MARSYTDKAFEAALDRQNLEYLRREYDRLLGICAKFVGAYSNARSTPDDKLVWDRLDVASGDIEAYVFQNHPDWQG